MTSTPTDTQSRLWSHWRELVIVGLTCLAFLPSIWGGFAFDDRWHILENESVRHLGRIISMLFEPTYPGNLYRPIASFSFAIEHALVGDAPFLYHLVNLLLHAGCSVFLFWILQSTRFRSIAFTAAVLFVVHPLKAEAVANVTGRYELLAACFALGSILAVLRGVSSEVDYNRWFILAAALGLAGMLSKESALTLPVLVGLVLLSRREPVDREHAKTIAALFLAAVSLSLMLRSLALGALFPHTPPIAFIDNPLIAFDAGERFLHALTLLGRYIWLLVAPFQLSADYSFAHLNPTLDWSTESLVCLLLTSALLAWFALGARRMVPGFFMPAWFLGAFLVTANVFFTIGTIFAERLCYLPSVGILMGIAWLLKSIRGTYQRHIAVSLLVSLYCGLSIEQSLKWRNDRTLWAAQAGISPKSVKTQMNLAVTYRNADELENAKYAARQSQRLAPSLAQPHVILATIAIAEEDEVRAEQELRTALRLEPANAEALNLLGRLAYTSGRVSQAGKLFRLAQRIHPGDFDSLIGLLALAVQQNDWERARKLRDTLQLRRPRNPELRRLAVLIPEHGTE